MGHIQLLSEQLANLIAAGEVVERPSSIVKELVENSIDAGSKRIDVSLEDSGLSYIRVLDYGSGMEAEDCELAFLRHATSKIKTSRDLMSIRTLGFRGEALPSIAAVSRLTCVSCANDSGLGRKILIEGGRVVSVEDVAASRGTEVIVRDLFFNTPARLKYMKSLQTELGHVTDFIYRLAIAHPHIAFTLKHHGHVIVQTSGHPDRLQVLAAIYGASISKQMIEFDIESLDYRIKGFISKPELTRSNRSGITTIINGRYVRSIALYQAIIQGYHTLLPIHRYPLVVLDITMDPTIVDVNVHPAKLEVRFSKEIELSQLVEHTIKQKLGNQLLIPEMNPPKVSFDTHIQEQLHLKRAAPADVSRLQYGANTSTYTSPSSSTNAADAIPNKFEYPSNKAHNFHGLPQQVKEQFIGSTRYDELHTDTRIPSFPQLSPIGQLHGTYVLAQNESGLYVIDQHAAHERIQYEYFVERFGNPEPASQELLVPLTLQFTSSEASVLTERLMMFEQMGLYIEPFGGNAFMVRAYPQWLPEQEEQVIIEEMCEWILNEKKSIDLTKFREKAAILCSCKASVKANQHLSLVQLEALLDRLALCKNPYTCPHGRPIVISFSTYELEKMFKRVM